MMFLMNFFKKRGMNMRLNTSKLGALTFVACCAFSMGSHQVKAEMLASQKLASDLRAGGYVIYFRHFETGRDTPDQVTADINQCRTQRNINVEGFRQAQRVSDAFAHARIPVARVVASPFCRAWQSADLAFGRHERIDGLKLPPAKDYTPAQKEEMRKALLPFLTSRVAAGSNLVIMGHDDNLPAAGGPELKRQGDAVIMKPDEKGGFSVIAELKVSDWKKLSKNQNNN
jgi:phosphohistidine phosphatase SixA